MDEFSAVCGSEQMSVGFGGVQVTQEMLWQGQWVWLVTPPRRPHKSTTSRGGLLYPGFWEEHWVPPARNHWGQGT